MAITRLSRLMAVTLVLAGSGAASGAEPPLTPLFYSGQLTDDCGVAQIGPAKLRIVVSSAAVGGTECVVTSPAQPLTAGRFHADVSACATMMRAWPTPFVAVEVNDVPLGPPRPIGAVPLAHAAASPPDVGVVGDTAFSILKEPAFQATHGAGWILADGRSIAGSTLNQLTGMTSAPDLRGEFVRGLDDGGSAKGARLADPGRGMGTPQSQTTARPTVAFSTDSSTHSHEVPRSAVVSGPNKACLLGQETAGPQDYLPTRAGGGNHTHTITGGGDAETRPRNVAVAIYVKIN